ncbi:pentatricopeptide repeat-containing protein At5g15280, mitochondrial [Cajanus cajan]|uniref:Pentatricopeptide repeat-containing protein At5g15280 family n=1 Tax=Cajanus cajan TaxID=3821 RepID=A0A151SBJ8_CAJCA|nr:pentatricopeptide repeat-containing protein At5g15280, mitochondrial [Cajanus cajan]KYP52192.1 Pentatricopeptide repeat-containing protein At5g15280 family [Cajanus cajan]
MLHSLSALRRRRRRHFSTCTISFPSLLRPNASLRPHLSDLALALPEATRTCWRLPAPGPSHVLHLLLASRSHFLTPQKVRSLWQVFKWVARGNAHFASQQHLSQSREIMASLVVRAGLFKEAEELLFAVESDHFFDDLVKGYVAARDWEKGVFVYDFMKGKGKVPSRGCYGVLVDLLVKVKKTGLASRVGFDLVGLGVPLSFEEMRVLEKVMVLLCVDGKIQEARNMVKKVLVLNTGVSGLVFDEIAFGYCDRKDFKDLISFFVEVKCAPSVRVANRVMDSLCVSYGVERARLFLLELESLGFSPDEVTYGILIGWSCRQGKMKNALSCLSVMLSKSLVPRVYTYNALISGLFKVGMLDSAWDILDEMTERGTRPDISTFRVLIAGYCKSRRFDKVKLLIGEMENCGLIKLSSVENPISKAFQILGLDPLSVKLKRDNDGRLSKTEFFDDVGNGLYLDADVDEYEKHITLDLEESMLPNFNSAVKKELCNGNLKDALVLVEEMLWWGQELLLPEFSKLVRQLCSSRSQIKSVTNLLEKMPKSAHKLDPESLNLVVQAYSKKGLMCKAKNILDEMLQNKFHVKNETYTAILTPSCKKGNMKDFNYYWDAACRNKWLPSLDDFKRLVVHICHQKMLKEASQFLEIMLLSYPDLKSDVCHVFLEVLSSRGLTDTAIVVLKQLQPSFIMDHAGYNILIRGLCNEEKFSLAFTMLDDMLDRDLAPSLDVSVLLIPQLCKAHKYDNAIALKDIIMKEHPSFSQAADCALICGFCNMGSIGKADALFRDMLSKGFSPDDELCNVLIRSHCQANDLRKVGELLGVAIRKDWELSLTSYRNLVQSICRKGRVRFALSLKNLILAQYALDGLIIYNILIFYLLSAGNSLVVNKILTEMEEKKIALDEVGHNFLVYGFLQCKDLSSSLHYLTNMISKGLKPSNRSLRKVISSLCDAGDLQKALELSQEMRLRGWMHDSSVQTSIVESLLLCGKIQEAETFLDRMGEESLTPDNINYDYLIKCFCQHGRLNKAVHLVNTMLKKQNIPISTSYDFLIHGFCAQNKLDIALNFFSEMLNWNLKPRIDTVEMLVHRFCQDGKTELAEQFLVDMTHGGETPSRKMYCTVIKSYHMEKNLRKASELMQAMQESGFQPDFEIHWSLISNLNSAKAKDTAKGTKGFLSSLLSRSGFLQKK